MDVSLPIGCLLGGQVIKYAAHSVFPRR